MKSVRQTACVLPRFGARTRSTILRLTTPKGTRTGAFVSTQPLTFDPYPKLPRLQKLPGGLGRLGTI